MEQAARPESLLPNGSRCKIRKHGSLGGKLTCLLPRSVP